MPNSPSAKKALRKSLTRRDQNRPQRTALRNAVKKVRKAAEAQDEAGARNAFKFAVKKLDQSADKELIHKNTAARVKSRLSALLKRTFNPDKVAQPAS
ncbi:MAG: 30S ribosomal protein S20 [Planctomycetota bacterium]|nr:30S ribosomal protein S20 [Planctomycetaceae bacterium]MDQ3332551.1 30S ribosomal protein S20 [Planctomycetota bacterium]